MADFSNSTGFQATRPVSPGQPRGLDQVREDRASGRLQPWQQPTGSFVDVAQRWYTGANQEGMTNGWDTPFFREASRQRGYYLDKAIETNDPSWYTRWLDTDPSSPTRNATATGVALWNDPKAFGRGDGMGIKVGDVFEDGKWVYNLYERYSDDRPTADLLMVDWVLEQDEKADLWGQADRVQRTSEAMDARFTENTNDIAAIRGSLEFQQERQERQEGILESAWWQAGNVLAAGSATAAMAASAAAAPSLVTGQFSPVVTGLAAVGGFFVGAGGAIVNRDNISNIEATALEVIERNRQQNPDQSKVAAFLTGAEQWTQVAMSAINPVTNLVGGANDAFYGEIGNAKEEFYDIDPLTGNQNASLIAQGTQVAAAFADGMFQFMSPVGAGLYLTTTGVNVASKAGGMVLTDQGFNYRTGQFDTYDGAGETLAAWGAVGIDAVQFLGAGGLASMGKQARNATGIDAASVGKGDTVVMGGMSYKTNQLDEALSRRFSLQMLAPSEAVQAVVIGQRARYAARERGVANSALTADDYYRAAKELTRQSRVSNAMVVGVAEGTEEAVQAVLEPISFSEDIELGQVGNSAIMGWAGGLGMSAGASFTAKTQGIKDKRERRDSGIARGLAELAENREFTDEEWTSRWDRMSDAEKRRARILGQRTAARHNGMVRGLEQDLALDTGTTSVIGVVASNQYMEKQRDEALKDSNPERAGMYQLQARPTHRTTGSTGLQQQVFAENASLMSLFEVMQVIRGNRDLAERDIADIKTQTDRWVAEQKRVTAETADIAQRITNGETGLADLQEELKSQAAHVKRQMDAVTERTRDQEFDLAMATEVTNFLLQLEDAFNQIPTGDVGNREDALDDINDTIVAMARGQWAPPAWAQSNRTITPAESEAVRRAVEMILIREPKLGLGSYDLSIPQASYELTFTRTNGIIESVFATFKPKNADTDGDTFAKLRTQYLRSELRNQLRRGIQFFNVTSTHSELDDQGTVTPVNQVRDMLARDQVGLALTEAANEAELVTLAAIPLNDADPTRQQAARAMLAELELELRVRYTTMPGGRPAPVTLAQFSQAWDQFEKDLEAGVEGARTNFMNALVMTNPTGFMEMSDRTFVREPVHIMTRIFDLYDSITTEAAADRYADQEVVTPSGALREIPASSGLRAREVQRAKNAGKTLQVLGSSQAERRHQQQHYGLYRSTAVAQEMADSGFVPDVNADLIHDYGMLGGAIESEIDTIMNKYSLEDRVEKWLMEIVAISELADDPTNAMLVLAQAEVPNVVRDKDGNAVIGKGRTSLIQLLTRRSIEIEKIRQQGKPEDDPVWAKLDRLTRMTQEQGPHSVSAKALPMAILGGRSNFDLMGESSIYIGSQMTPDQMLRILMSQNLTQRRATGERWKRQAGYVKEHGLGDPPYKQEDIEAGRINAYAIVVDSVIALANVSEKDRDRQDDRGSKTFQEGFTAWKKAVDTYGQQHSRKLGNATREAIVKDFLDTHPEWARSLVQMIPETAHRATFMEVDGTIRQSSWVMKVLTEENAERAEVMTFVLSEFATYNMLQGTAASKAAQDGKPVTPEDSKLRYSQINSQFLRMLFMLQQEDPTMQEVYAFVETALEARSLLGLRDAVNGRPNWLRTDAPWHPYTNDVGAYESTVTDLFGGSQRDAKRMEDLSKFAKGAKATRESSTRHSKQQAQDKITRTHMRDNLNNGSNVNDAAANVANLRTVVEHRKMYPDALGPTVMREFLKRTLEHWGRGHDKGKPVEEASNMGQPQAFKLAFGLGTDLEQEMSAITSNTAANVLTNPTKLAEGPVRVGNKNGSETVVRLDTAEGILDALDDPTTESLGLSVIEATVRDLNAQGQMSVYADRTREGRPLSDMLERAAKFTDVFDENVSRLERALRGIGLIEASLAKTSLDLSLDEQDRYNHPILRAIADFTQFYTHSVTGERMDTDALYERTVIAVWESLLEVVDQPAQVRAQLQTTLENLVLDQWGDPMAAFDLYASDPTKVIFNSQWLLRIQTQYQDRENELARELNALTQQMATQRQAATPNQQAIDAIQEQIDWVVEQQTRASDSIQALASGQVRLPRRLFASWETTLNKYTLTGDPVVDLARKKAIASWLVNQNQVARFDGKKSAPLARRLVAAWGDADYQLEVLADANELASDWAELGAMAAAIEIEAGAGLPASWTSAIPLNTDLNDPKSLNKYFDVTGFSLTDVIFDPLILKAVEHLTVTARASSRKTPSIHGYRTAAMNVRKKLFPPDMALGEWESTAVKQALWVQQLIAQASTAITIPIGGDAANRQAEPVGASMFTYGQPAAEHMTTVQVNVTPTPGQDVLVDLIAGLPMFQTEGHFFSRIKLTPTSGNVASQAVADFEAAVGLEPLIDVGDNGQFRVFQVERAARLLQQMRTRDGLESFTLDIEIVDVDKKPHTPDHVNSAVFDGLGRDAALGGYSSPLASMFFGLSGLANITQQKPLDALAKAGQAFRAFKTIRFGNVEAMEQGTIKEIIERKSWHMWSKKYTFGFLLYGDMPAVYKWVKARHLVTGINPVTNEQEFWWSERYLSAEATGSEPLLQNAKIVPLNEMQYRRIVGMTDGSSQNGESGGDPNLRLQDVNVFPVITRTRLKKLGLGDLSTKANLNSSDVRQQGLMATMVRRQPRDMPYSTMDKRATTWADQKNKTLLARGGVASAWSRDTGERINAENFKIAKQFATQAHMSAKREIQLIPDTVMRNTQQLAATDKFVDDAKKDLTAGAIVWSQIATQRPDDTTINPPNAALGQFDSRDAAQGFKAFGERGPVFGDMVLFHMNSYLIAAGGDRDKALELFKIDARHYTDRGVTILLGSDVAMPEFRTMAGQYLESGQLGYEAEGHAIAVFKPRLGAPEKTRTQQAHASTRWATRVFKRSQITLRAVGEWMGTTSTEGSQQVFSYADPEIRAAAHTVIPAFLTGVDGNDNRSSYVFGLPKGLKGPTSRQVVLEKLQKMLNDPEMYAHLLAQMGQDPKMPIYKQHPNGTWDPGVLSKDDALKRLKDAVNAGDLPGEIGTLVMTGGIVPLVSSNGVIYLQRLGFKAPKHHQMDNQRRQFPAGAEGMEPHNIVVSMGEFDDMWTVAPPFVINDYHPDINGLHVYGDYDLSYFSKWIDALGALKTAGVPVPKLGQFVTQVPIGRQQENPLAITRGMPFKELDSKQAGREGLITNFRNALALGGWDARGYLLRFFGYDTDSMNDDDFTVAWNSLSDMLSMYADTTNFDEDAVSEALLRGTHAGMIQGHLNEIRDALKPGHLQKPFTFADTQAPQDDPQDFIARRVLAVLGMRGVKLEDVAYSKGLIDAKDDEEITMLPDALTASFFDVKHPEVHDFLIEEINARIPQTDPDGKRYYTLKNNWKWDVQFDDRLTGKTLLREVYLQIIMPVPAKENPHYFEQSILNRGPRATSTVHTNLMDAVALGGQLVSDRDLERGFGNQQITQFQREESSFYGMLTNVSRVDPNYVRKPKNLPLMQRFIDRCITKVAAYHHRVDKTGWSPLVEQNIDKFLKTLNLDLTRDRAEVDYLVRQFWGAPGPFHGQTDFNEQVTEELYLKALGFMQKNIDRPNRMHPLHGGVVPFEHRVFWEKVFNAQASAANPWGPLATTGGKRKDSVPETWDEWVGTLVGQFKDSDKRYSAMFVTDIAGFWQTYAGSMKSHDIASLSPEASVNAGLFNVDANEYVLSLDPNMNAIFSDPMLTDVIDKTLDALTGMTQEYSDIGIQSPDALTMGDRYEHISKWHGKRKLRPQKKQSFRSYMKEGQMYMESDRQLNNAVAGFIHLQIINRLFLPALWAAAYIEVPFRSAIERATDVMTGNNVQASGKLFSDTMEKLGYTPRVTRDDINSIDDLAPSLGASNELMQEVFKQYTKRWYYGAEGTIGDKLASVAGRVALLFADPRRGMRNASIGRLYMNGLIQYAMDTDTSMDVQQIVWQLSQDPMYFAKQAQATPGRMTLHQAGLNRVAQTRGFRDSFTGRVIMSPVTALLQSDKAYMQIMGAGLFTPLAFTSFVANYFVMLTGMQLPDQALARLMDGRKPWFSRLSQVVYGDNYDPEQHDRIDMTDAMDGMNLSRAVIQSGMSWTALFTLGMLASASGLTGEDEEERRRRKMAMHLNLPTYIDPIKGDDGSPHGIGGAEHDFRQVDAIYLDETFLGNHYKADDGRSAVVPMWIIQQYTQPMMGMAKAFETGDMRHLFSGFWKAAAVIPYSMPNLWRQANETIDVMAMSAEAATEQGTEASEQRRRTLWTATVGIAEQALINNQFVNTLYAAADQVDRAPWLVPGRDQATNEILREPGTGYPMAQDQALQPTVRIDPVTGEETEIGATYFKRDQEETAKFMRAERNPIYGMIASVFSGQWNPMTSEYNRFNMVPRGRDIPLKEVEEEVIQSSLMAAFAGAGGQKVLTEDEIVRILKRQAEDAGASYDMRVLEAQAQVIAESSTGPNAMSIVGPDGRETVTPAGMERILDGLSKGSITLDSPTMRGVWATRETLDKIEKEWMAAMEEESLSFGLTKTEADYRWRRFWWGDQMDPGTPGLKYLFDQIPTEPDARYTQLNTTYVLGPDGKAWATPFERATIAQAFGIPVPHTKVTLGEGLTMDSRANVVDEVLGINTGLNALAKNPYVPEEQEENERKVGEGSKQFGYGPRKFKRFKRGGGYGGGGGGFGPNFQRMLPLPEGRFSPRPNEIANIYVDQPQTRRADIRRERISSERGRLKQWQ